MTGLVTILEEQEQFSEILSALKQQISPIKVTGTAESQKLHLAFSLCSKLNRNMVYIAPDPLTAKFCLEDLKFFASEDEILFYPQQEYLFYQVEAKSRENTRKRLCVLDQLCRPNPPKFVLTTMEALCQKTINREDFLDRSLTLKLGAVYEIPRVAEKLVRLGYKRENTVETNGQFSVRGGIIDVFPFSSEMPYRIEFFDDEIDSIRIFDIDSQLSVEKCSEFTITPATEEIGEKSQTLLSYTENSLYFLDEPHHCAEGYDSFLEELKDSIKNAVEKDYLKDKKSMDPATYIESFQEVVKQMSQQGLVGLSNLSMSTKGFSPKEIYSLVTKSAPSYNGNLPLLYEDLSYYILKKYRIVLPCGNEAKAKRLQNELTTNSIPSVYLKEVNDVPQRGIVSLVDGALHRGFEYPLTATVIISDQELTGESKKKKPLRKKGSNIRTVSDIKEGDYVVHQTHGIGIYKGIHQLTVDNVTKDYLKIQYKSTDMLYVPVNQLNLINKYIGSESKVHINKLGGNEWNKAKSKVKQSVEILAKDLIDLYAARENMPGYSFSADTPWQKEFEDTFLYEETEDQLKAIEEVKKDMESSRPMDRLLCGDVGYGKTEVAIRAAFKAVMDGKQVAYLVPTTILAKQHYENFVQRMKDFPIKVDMLSRFRSKKQQEQTVNGLRKGEVDIIIGTHRIIQKDIVFKNLGLLIIDEEQRFGVAHKEKIKELKKNVDVLTLTATPIPRTLNMAMTGLRDMSILNEPPQDRHPVQTYVMEYNEEAIKNAIKREIARNGQVYYLYNRVESIDNFALKLQKLIPEARITVAHGQMNERYLENIMLSVLNGEADILVCTTIIETGLDIPNINTIIIEDADKFGLAQLYQLRGRVGRSSRLAYAYLTVRKNKVLDQVAEKRLEAIKEFTEFGSGFKIAMRDLEIRGAGSVLGAKQHGHMDQVGYDLYCKLLASAVRQLKNNEEIVEEQPLSIDLAVDNFIPESYIADQATRIDVYKSIASIESQQEAYELENGLTDRFGDLPRSVENLVNTALIRNEARLLGITEITQNASGIVMKLSAQTPMDVVVRYIGDHKKEFVLRAGDQPSLIYKANLQKKDLCQNIKIVLQQMKQLQLEKI